MPDNLYETTGYHERERLVIANTGTAKISVGIWAHHPDHVHQITQATLAELVDPTPAELVQRALTALEHTTPAEDTPCVCCGKPDRLGELDAHGRCKTCLWAIGRGLDWVEGKPA